LDRVDNDRTRLQTLYFVKNVLQISFRKQIKIGGAYAQSLATKLDLPFRLFTGDVEDNCAARAQFVGDL
jgi:hypothetical protein